MNPEIFLLPNKMFYNNELFSDRSVVGRVCALNPYGVFSLQSSQNLTQDIEMNTYNIDEVGFVMLLLKTMEKIMDRAEMTIGVITPYSRHKREMIKEFQKR